MPYYEKLYENGELSHRAKFVYLYLCDRCGKSGQAEQEGVHCEPCAWPGIKRIAADLSISRSTAKRALKDLVKAGLIRKELRFRENGSATSNMYYLL